MAHDASRHTQRDARLARSVIVFSCLSPRGREKRILQLRLYADAGITDVWAVNLDEECVERAVDPIGSGYRATRRYVRGDRIAPALLSDALLNVNQILIPQEEALRASIVNRL